MNRQDPSETHRRRVAEPSPDIGANAEPPEATGFAPHSAGRRGPRSRWRPVVILAAVMFGWLFLVLVVSAAVGQSGKLPAGVPLPVSHGVTIRPPSGWSSAAQQWNVGPNGVSLRKSGVIVAFAADIFNGTPQQLLDDQLSQLKQQFSFFQTLPPDSITLAGKLDGRRELFTGTQNGSSLDGELVTASSAGIGVAMLAIAPSGQLQPLQGDIDRMLATMVVP